MKHIVTAAQMREADQYTIRSRGIRSLELMELASEAFVAEFCQRYADLNQPVAVFCGNGNNGGDGLAIARLLADRGYNLITVYCIEITGKASEDYNLNLERLAETEVQLHQVETDLALPERTIIIDAILGSGLNRPVSGQIAELIEYINGTGLPVVSVDIPSGLPSDGMIDPAALTIRSELVITFQRSKLSFFFPESGPALKQFKVVNIGLDESYLGNTETPWRLTERCDIVEKLLPRQSFTHKGTYGHALIIAGSSTAMGAALLCTEACMNTGAGLISAAIPVSGLTALNGRLPEAMYAPRESLSEPWRFDAVAFGPGMGTGEESRALLETALSGNKPLVLDADAFSVLAAEPALLDRIPAGTVLTPHMKEFDRLFRTHDTWFSRLETARKQAQRLNSIILLKNQYSFIVLPDGEVMINPTGNPGMATGGMGDVLTGIIVSLLAQGYSAPDAAIIGCFLHGEAGDELRDEGMAVVRPTTLIKRLPYVIGRL